MKKILYFILLLFILSCSTIKTNKNISYDYYQLGNEFFNLEKYDKAITFYLKSLDYYPNSSDTIINLILTYQKTNKYELVENLIYKYYSKRINEFNNKLLLLLGNNFFLQGKYNLALKTYDEYIKINPQDSNCLFNIGLSYQKLSDNANALNYFLKSYENNKSHIPSIYNIADYYYNEKNYQKSLYYFSLLEKLDSSNSDIFYRLGELEFLIEEYELAKKHLLESIKLQPENNDYFILSARIYSKGFNDKAKTIEYLDKAFKNKFNNLNLLKSYKEFNLLFEYEEFKKILKIYNLK